MAAAPELRLPDSGVPSSSVRGGFWPRRPPSEIQWLRILSAMAEVCCEAGIQNATVASVISRVKLSRRTFYDFFEDRLDCFLAVFDGAVAQADERIRAAYGAERSWLARVRTGLAELLLFMKRSPSWCGCWWSRRWRPVRGAPSAAERCRAGSLRQSTRAGR